MKPKNKEDFHINVLRFVMDNPNSRLSDIAKRFNKTVNDFDWIYVESNSSKYFYRINPGKGAEYEFIISIEGRSVLLGYDKLEQANKSSKIATYFAFAAMIIAIIVGSAQIYISTSQIHAPVRLNSVQYKTILEVQSDFQNVNSNINSLERVNKSIDSTLLEIKGMLENIREKNNTNED